MSAMRVAAERIGPVPESYVYAGDTTRLIGPLADVCECVTVVEESRS